MSLFLKNIFSLLVIFNFTNINHSYAQCNNVCGPNLVPNGDFETPSSNCADTISELFENYTSLEHWYGTDEWSCYPQPPIDCNAGSTPDYHNSNCNGSANDVGCGSGNGALGLFTSTNIEGRKVFGGTVSQNREYAQVKLNTPLEAGKQYCASMLVKSSYPSPINVSADGIGMWFTDQKVNIDTQNNGQQFIGPGSLINAVAQVENPPGNIIDSTCTIVSGTFCANGGEEWLVIGNFLEDINLSTNDPLGLFLTPNYMIIDDVNVQAICEPNPVLNVSNSSIYCGTPINVEVTDTDPTANFEWLSPTNFTSNTSAGPFTDTPQDDTDYTVVVKTDNGCGNIFSDTLTSSVLVDCGPEIELDLTSDTICIGSCTDIYATISGGLAPYTISWNQGISNGPGPHIICPTSTTTYQATVTDANGHSKDTSITLYVGTPDSIYQLHSICAGSSITLYGTTYTANGIYPETFTNIYGCDSIEYNEVVVLPSETNINIIKKNLTDCSLSDGTITFTGLIPDSTYSISYDNNGVIGPNNYIANSFGEITISGLDIGVYTDFMISIQGCSTTLTDQITITSPNTPTVSAGSDIEICENETITLSVTPGAGETISWNNGVTNGVPFTPSSDTTIYTVSLTNTSGCIATDEVMVVAKPLPSIDAGQDMIICEGQETILEINGNDNYFWNQGVSNGVPFTPTIGTTSYVVTAIDENGCEAIDSLNISVIENADVSIFTNDSVGCAPFTVEFSSGSSNPGEQCLWELGDGTTITGCGTISHTFENPGTYDISLTQIHGATNCSNSITEENLIIVGEVPVASFNYSPHNPSEENPLVQFVNQSSAANSYIWTFNDSTQSNETDPTHLFPDESGVYEVQLIASSNAGCSDTSNLKIFIDESLRYYIPNTFTPDGNGDNDYFLPIMTSGFDPSDYKLTIFNRWGELIFESHNPFLGWDGKYKDKIVPDGTYIWILEFRDNNTEEKIKDKGHVNLIR